jgi:ribosome-binding ATPase
MKAAIIGLPQSGKSTVFAAASGKVVDPYAPPEVQPAVVRVPDSRVDWLTDHCKPKKTILATFELADIPGCDLSDSKGRADWRKLLPTVRQAELLVVVVRDFEDPSVPMHKDRVDPQADFDEVWTELVFSDLEAVTNRIAKLEHSLKKPTKTHDAEKAELTLLQRCHEALESEKPLADALQTESDKACLSSFGFLTEKPVVCVRNVGDDVATSAEPLSASHAVGHVVMSASIEADIAQLDADDRPAFLAELGIAAPASDRLIQTCYDALGLISFLTMGPDEVRAWTIRKGSTAQEAAGKIHSDLSRGFIRAETVAYDDLVANCDMKGAKAAGKVRKEGKTYIVADGDIMNILANT